MLFHINKILLMFFLNIFYCQLYQQQYKQGIKNVENLTTTTTTTTKYLNLQCDFEKIPARGCYLRESYCSLHKCICKPDYPINIADRLCLSKLKTIGDQCEYNEECQQNSICSIEQNNNNNINNIRNDENILIKKCQCKYGYIYSYKQQKCIKGLKGSYCNNDNDCYDQNMFCSMITCECKYGYEWSIIDEYCLKRSKYGEFCEQSINCKINDEFSECDLITKRCICGKFLSHKYTLDELTRRCISCPKNRLNKTTNTCLPEKTTVEYNLLDNKKNNKKSLQYSLYIAISMSPFFIFALIGFIYRYINPYGTLSTEQQIIDNNNNHHNHGIIDNINDDDDINNNINVNNLTNNNNNNNTVLNDIISPSTIHNSHYCLSVNLDIIMDNNNNNTNNNNNDNTFPFTSSICDTLQRQPQQQHQHQQTICLLSPQLILPEPPPSYDLSSQDLPPSYDEVIAEQQQQQQQQQQELHLQQQEQQNSLQQKNL